MLCGQRLDTQVPAKLFRRNGVVSAAGWCRRLNLKISRASAALTCPVGFDPSQIQPRLPAPWQARSAPAQAGAAGFPAVRASGEPLACGLRPSAIAPGKGPPDLCFRVLWRHKKCFGPLLPRGDRRWRRGSTLIGCGSNPPGKTSSRVFTCSSALAEKNRSGILVLVGRHQGVAAPEGVLNLPVLRTVPQPLSAPHRQASDHDKGGCRNRERHDQTTSSVADG